jgi:hypothetical protein
MADLSQFEKLNDEVRPLAHASYDWLRVQAPQLGQMTRWGFPSFVGNSTLISVCGQKQHVNVQFYMGSKLADPQNLLEGSGKSMRHVKIRKRSDLDQAGLGALVEAAIVYDQTLPDEGLRAKAEKL